MQLHSTEIPERKTDTHSFTTKNKSKQHFQRSQPLQIDSISQESTITQLNILTKQTAMVMKNQIINVKIEHNHQKKIFNMKQRKIWGLLT